MICKNCGTENEEGNVFCINCGSRVEGEASSAPPLESVVTQEDTTVMEDLAASAPPPFVSSEASTYTPPPVAPAPMPPPAGQQPPVQPMYAPPPMYQQPAPPPPPPPPVMPTAPKGPPDTCRILRAPTAPDMPGLSFFDGTTGQYFLYMLLFGFLNSLVVAMPIVLIALFAGGMVTKTGNSYELNVDFAQLNTGTTILLIVVGILALIVMLLLMSWMYTVLLRWMSHHTIVNDHRLVFVGRVGELMKKIVIYWLLTVVTLGIFSIWVPVKLLRWKAANTRFAT